METKRELVLKALHGEKTDRIPVGFWYHYMPYEEMNLAMKSPEIFEKNINGHRKLKKIFKPDFLKIMTDGLFFLPFDYAALQSAADLKGLEPIPETHPWFDKNVELVRTLREMYGDDILIYFNMFAPMTQMRDGIRVFQGISFDIDRVIDFLKEDAEAVKHALLVFAQSLETLMKKVIGKGLADGVYFSVSNPHGDIPTDIYKKYIMPSEKFVLEKAKELSEDNILHICGNVGGKEMFSIYQDYDVRAVNWAIHASGLSLKEGREYFKGKAIIGGFDNSPESVLCSGTKEEVEACAEQVVQEAGRDGLILGADCTIPSDIDLERLEWVRRKAAAL